MSPTRKIVQCLSPTGLHHMAYKEWGEPDNPHVLICVHGVTRVSDDFDALAMAMCDEYRVICPDVVGRGYSGWLKNPAHYQIPQYVSDMVTLLARVNADQVDWLGTSMGGLIGLGLASLADSPISKLILNDVGPALNYPALERIRDYIGQDTCFAGFEQAAAYVRSISLSFGQHTEQEWAKLARDVLRQTSNGDWRRHYDLAIAEPFKHMTPEVALATEAKLWEAYDAVHCQTLLIRGEHSDLLSQIVAEKMTQRGPCAELVVFPNVGHAPMFYHADQIAVVREFLLRDLRDLKELAGKIEE